MLIQWASAEWSLTAEPVWMCEYGLQDNTPTICLHAIVWEIPLKVTQYNNYGCARVIKRVYV